MGAALNAAIAPWAQLGIVGSVVLALGLLNWLQWRRGEELQKTIDALHEARLADREKCTERISEMLVKMLDTNNRVADGMEAMERIFEKVRP